MPAVKQKPDNEIAAERVMDRLIAEEKKKIEKERAAEEHRENRERFRAERAAERLAAVRAVWKFDAFDLSKIAALWQSMSGGNLFSCPIGANGRGGLMNVAEVKRGRHTVYALCPPEHCVIATDAETMKRIVKAHQLPDTLAWSYHGREYRLYSAPRFKRSLLTENVHIVAGRSQERMGYKLTMTGASWIVPPAEALADGADKVPELPAAFIEAFTVYGFDLPGVAALESFVLGK